MFELTIEQMWALFERQRGKCALSGLPIAFGRYRRHGHAHSNRERLSTASLDRIDSSGGYVVGNVQWTHKYINKMKGTFSQQKFVELCKAVAAAKRPEAGL